MPAISAHHRSSGMTLLEILLAMLIFSIVITTIFGSYNAVFSTVDVLKEDAARYEMGRESLQRMSADLQSLHITSELGYAPPEFNDPPDPHRFIGESSYTAGGTFARLRFTSLAHLPIGETHRRAGIAEIVYYVTMNDDGRTTLRRADSLFPHYRYNDGNRFEEDLADPVLCEDVRGFSIVYINTEGTEQEVWRSEDEQFGYATPRSLKIRLEIGDDQAFLPFETVVALPVFREPKED
jgi:general secretion pathway protein J